MVLGANSWDRKWNRSQINARFHAGLVLILWIARQASIRIGEFQGAIDSSLAKPPLFPMPFRNSAMEKMGGMDQDGNHSSFPQSNVDMPQQDFDLDSLATYLRLTPDQVRRMAERNRIPGRKVGGEWRFSRAEVHHWFEEKIGRSGEDELLDLEKVLDHQQPTSLTEIALPEWLSVERIAVPLLSRTRNSVIEDLCQFAAQSGALWMPEEMATAIRNREALHPTALENGVALLHPRRPQPSLYGESFLALGITRSGIPFGGPRGVLTDIFFLIASADEPIHLRILARLSRLIQSDELLAELRDADSAAQAWEAIRIADENLDS